MILFKLIFNKIISYILYSVLFNGAGLIELVLHDELTITAAL